MSEHQSTLEQAISSGNAVLVLGAGVSRALSDNAPQSDWVGLIRHGVQYVESIGAGTESWAAMQSLQLDQAVEDTDADGLITVASAVVKKLRLIGEQAYGDWLEDTIGKIPLVDKKLAVALSRLGTPLLTTNYDTLVEQATNLRSFDWGDLEGMRSVLRMDLPGVAHLHGVWDRSDGVVLSEADYFNLLNQRSAQFLQQAYYATKSFIYIGFGAGLDDPNFGRMLKLHAELFPASRAHHFRLCREQELASLNAHGANLNIKPVSYGANYSDLGDFVESLARSREAVARSGAVEFARQALVEQVRESTVIVQGLDDLDHRELEQMTVPPVLLPMEHSQFASAQSLEGDLRPQRLDPNTVALTRKITIVAADELSGLTTTLRWLLSRAGMKTGGVAPVLVDARSCTPGAHPLRKLVRQEARNLRLIDGHKDPLPRIALAVDNLKARDGRLFDDIVRDLQSLDLDTLLIGCRTGDELEIAEALAELELPTEVVYQGKLSEADIESLAAIAAPGRAGRISPRVLIVIQREHLPRNPLTVSLLIALLLRGDIGGTQSSETDVLDQYVRLLIGWNGPFVDARLTLNPQNREAVLAELAKHMVSGRSAALSFGAATELIRNYFESVGWEDHASETLTGFIAMRILRNENDFVQFRQTSYLHLFAAKAAQLDNEFLRTIQADPTFYAPVVRHYAALNRSSLETLHVVDALLDEWLTDIHTTTRIFGKFRRVAAPKALRSGVSDDADGGIDEDPPVAGGEDPGVPENPTEYDISNDADIVPFPFEDLSKLSPSARLAHTVDLVSRVLRDSDQIANVSEKNRVLARVLRAWGRLVDHFETDETFWNAAESIGKQLAEQGEIPEVKVDDFVERLKVGVPLFVTQSGIAVCLASRKLSVALENVQSVDGFFEDSHAAVAAGLLSMTIGGNGWASRMRDIVESHSDRWVVSFPFASLMYHSYMTRTLSSSDEANLRDAIIAAIESRYNFESPAAKARQVAKYAQRLELERMTERRKLTLSRPSTA